MTYSVTFSYFWDTIAVVYGWASPLTLFTGWCTGIVMLENTYAVEIAISRTTNYIWVHSAVVTFLGPLVAVILTMFHSVTGCILCNAFASILAFPLTLVAGESQGLKGEEQPDGSWHPSPHPPQTYLRPHVCSVCTEILTNLVSVLTGPSDLTGVPRPNLVFRTSLGR